MNQRISIIFVDSRVNHAAALLTDLKPGTEVVYLDPEQDGISQMAQALAGRSDIDAIHVVSHGAEGSVQLGNLQLSSANIGAHAADLATIGQALGADGDIVLYGCDTGAGADGAALVQTLATLTGAEVAASSDLTGSASLGGNWTMEVQSGQIEAALPFSAGALQNFDETLASGTALETQVTGTYDINQGIVQLTGGNQVELYLHQVGGDNSYNTSYPEYVAKLVIANSANQIINTVTIPGSDYALYSSVAKLADGGFVVSWTADTSVGHDMSSGAIYYQIYDASGVAQGSAQLLGDGTGQNASLTALAGGGFAAAYKNADNAETLSVYGYSNGAYSLTRTTSVGGNNGPLISNGTDTNVRVWSMSDSTGGRPEVMQLSDGSIVIVDSTYVYSGPNYTPLGQYAFKFASDGQVANFASGYSTQRLSWGQDGASGTGLHAMALSGGGFVSVGVSTYQGRSMSYEMVLLNNDGTPVDPGSTITRTVRDASGTGSTVQKTTYAQVITAADANTSGLSGAGRFALTESSDGKILVALSSGDNTGYQIYTYTHGGAQDGASYDSGLTPTVSGMELEHAVLVPLSGGGFTLSYNEVSIDQNWLHTGTAYSYLYVTNTAPAFIGATTSTTAAQNGTAVDVAALLHVSDTDSGQTLSWTQDTAPSHGTLGITGANAASGGSDITSGGVLTYTPNAGYAGTDSFTVQVSDGIATATRTITVNVAPATPGAPVLSSASDSGASQGDHVTNSGTLSFSGAGGTGDSASTVRVFIDQNNNGSYDAGTDASGTATLVNGAWSVSNISTSAVSDGTYHVYAITTSATGSLSSAVSTALDVTIDKSAPTTTFSGLALSDDSGVAGDFVTNNASQTVTATLSAALAGDETLYGSLDNGATWIDISSMVSGTTLSWTGVTLGSSGTLKLRITDDAGNNGSSSSHAYTVDGATPAVPTALSLDSGSDTGAPGDRITSDSTPLINGSGEANASVTLYLGSTVLGTTTADSSGNWSITSSVALGEGSHDLSARQTDLAGNESSSSSALTLVVDTVAPTGVALSASTVLKSAASSGATIATLSNTDTNASGVQYALAAGGSGADADNAKFSISGSGLVASQNLTAGTYHVYVQATDAAGNSSQQALVFDVLDAPGVSSIARANSASSTVPTAATSVDYTVTFDQPVTGVDINDFALTATATASGTITAISGSGASYTITVSNISGDGTLRLDLNSSGTGIRNGSSVDLATGFTSGQTYQLDHTAPAAPSAPTLKAGSDSGSSNSDAITNEISPFFSGTGEANATVRLYDTDGTTVLGSATVDGTGHWEILTGMLTEEVHTLTVKQTDAAGNVSDAGGSVEITIDYTSPTDVALSTGVVAQFNATSGATVATLSNTDAYASGVQYALVAGGSGADADNAKFTISGNGLVASQNLTAGTYHVYVEATDAAGNSSLQALTFDVVDAPGVSSIARANSASSTVLAAATSVDYTVTFSQSVTGVGISDFALTSSGTATGTIASISGSGDTYTITVNNISGDGTLRLDLNNSGTGIQNGSSVSIAGGFAGGQTYTLDHTAPSAPVTPVMTTGTDTGSSSSDAITSNTAPHFSGTADANASITLYEGGTVLGTTTADSSGGWTITSNTLSAGSHTLTVKQSDAAGNVSAASGTLAVVIDTAAAAPTLVLASASDSGTLGDHVTNAVTPTITGTAEANATITLYDTDQSTVLGTATANGSGAWSITSSTLSSGAHTLSARQTDVAGNVSVLSSGLSLNIDTTAPSAPATPLLAVASDSGTQGDNSTNVSAPVITGTGEANAAVKLYDTDGVTVLGMATADGSGNWSITSSTLSVGQHTLTIKQTDVAGNTSVASSALTLTIETPPVPPATTIDGVQVTEQPIQLPGGGTGTQIVIPVVTSGRNESSGSGGVADIPLSTRDGANLLLAQLPAGFGLTATGGDSLPAGNSLEHLIQAILAATPDHPSSDQGHLTGNGVTFLNQLAASVPLLVQTVVPSTTSNTPNGTLTLTGTSSAQQHTALVIDTTHMAAGSRLELKDVDFAAIVGAANVTGNTSGQILTGDAASQHFSVGAGSSSSVFSGGGDDLLAVSAPTPASGGARIQAAAQPGTTLLHGGQGNDTAVFSGARSDYTVEDHDGYVVVTANTQPSQHMVVLNAESLAFSDATVTVQNRAVLDSIAGLYRDILGRQGDYLGVEFWGTVEKSGVSLGKIAMDMIESSELQAQQGTKFTGDTAHDIELLYQSIFSRHSDAGGLAYWTEQMSHGVTLEQVAQFFVTSNEIEVHKIAEQNWDFLV